MYIYIYIHMYICKNIYIYTCIHTYIYIHIYMYIHIHICMYIWYIYPYSNKPFEYVPLSYSTKSCVLLMRFRLLKVLLYSRLCFFARLLDSTYYLLSLLRLKCTSYLTLYTKCEYSLVRIIPVHLVRYRSLDALIGFENELFPLDERD